MKPHIYFKLFTYSFLFSFVLVFTFVANPNKVSALTCKSNQEKICPPQDCKFVTEDGCKVPWGNACLIGNPTKKVCDPAVCFCEDVGPSDPDIYDTRPTPSSGGSTPNNICDPGTSRSESRDCPGTSGGVEIYKQTCNSSGTAYNSWKKVGGGCPSSNPVSDKAAADTQQKEAEDQSGGDQGTDNGGGTGGDNGGGTGGDNGGGSGGSSSSKKDKNFDYIAPRQTLTGYYAGVSGDTSNLKMVGWVCDSSNSSTTFDVSVYFDGYQSSDCVVVGDKTYCAVTGKSTTPSNLALNDTTQTVCSKTNTWFNYTVPAEIKDTAFRDFVILSKASNGSTYYLPPATGQTLRLTLGPSKLLVDTTWKGPIGTLTMPDGTTGKPSAQAEVYLGKVPNSNKGLVLQTVIMQANNSAYNRYGTVDFTKAATSNDRTQWTSWSAFEGPYNLSVFALPSSAPANGTINAYGLTLVPPNLMLQTVFVNNVGYSRYVTFSVNANGSASLTNAQSWQQISLGTNAPGSGTIQAYDLAYYSHDGGFYLETYAKNNNFYYRFLRPNIESSNILSKEGATAWFNPLPASTLPGQGDVITYSYYIINEKDYLSQAFWKSNSGGYFRELRSTVMNYPDAEPEIDYDLFDVNKDLKVDILDIIFLIQELFN